MRFLTWLFPLLLLVATSTLSQSQLGVQEQGRKVSVREGEGEQLELGCTGNRLWDYCRSALLMLLLLFSLVLLSYCTVVIVAIVAVVVAAAILVRA